MVKVNEMINIKIIRQKEDNIRKKTENLSNQRDIIYLVKKDNWLYKKARNSAQVLTDQTLS